MSQIIDAATLADLATVDESAMNDTCSILTRPVQDGGGNDWGGTVPADDGTWLAVNDPATGLPAIPCRAGMSRAVRADVTTGGVLNAIYNYQASVPIRLRGMVKAHDHLVWRDLHYDVLEVGDGTFATSILLVLQVQQ